MCSEMNAIEMKYVAGFWKVEMTSLGKPMPGPHEVLIRVLCAAGTTYTMPELDQGYEESNSTWREHYEASRSCIDVIPGCVVLGVVEMFGTNVSMNQNGLSVGCMVLALVIPSAPNYQGACAAWCCTYAHLVHCYNAPFAHEGPYNMALGHEIVGSNYKGRIPPSSGGRDLRFGSTSSSAHESKQTRKLIEYQQEVLTMLFAPVLSTILCCALQLRPEPRETYFLIELHGDSAEAPKKNSHSLLYHSFRNFLTQKGCRVLPIELLHTCSTNDITNDENEVQSKKRILADGAIVIHTCMHTRPHPSQKDGNHNHENSIVQNPVILNWRRLLASMVYGSRVCIVSNAGRCPAVQDTDYKDVPHDWFARQGLSMSYFSLGAMMKACTRHDLLHHAMAATIKSIPIPQNGYDDATSLDISLKLSDEKNELDLAPYTMVVPQLLPQNTRGLVASPGSKGEQTSLPNLSLRHVLDDRAVVRFCSEFPTEKVPYAVASLPFD